MSYSVSGTSITLTRGDTFIADLQIFQKNGDPYEAKPGDRIRFAMKQNIKDATPLILKEIPVSTMKLILEPEDTKRLAFGKYLYDVEITKANGDVDTFITKSTLTLTEEVY